ncbi:hypothetical protein TSUD_241510 [Trifolium subterraneum]|uniref:Uncharacterized protein n=1 Tax=Trifolium subterraneum TaxID=3900 RepID=A0A2Z6PK34_TRISU|nr:hypothetical protein TSUD_241510 [Trifolium subterraneum]
MVLPFSCSYGGQGKEQRHGQNYSSNELFSSAKVLSEAAQSVYNYEPGKVNKAKVVVSASEILGATGVIDETKGFGKYVDKGVDYLNEHDSSSGVAARGKSSHSSGGFGGTGGYGNTSGFNYRYGGGCGNNNESGYRSGRSGGDYGSNNVIGYGGGRSGGGYGIDDFSKSGYVSYDSAYGDGRRLSDGYGKGNRSSGRYGYGGRKSSEYRDENRSSGGYGGHSGGGYGNERSGSGYGNEFEGGYGRDGRESRPNYGYNYNN